MGSNGNTTPSMHHAEPSAIWPDVQPENMTSSNLKPEPKYNLAQKYHSQLKQDLINH